MAWKTTVDALSSETKPAEVINLQNETLHITLLHYIIFFIDSTTLNFILLKHHLLKNKTHKGSCWLLRIN